MPVSAEFRVDRVPYWMLRQAWPQAVRHLQRGAAVSQTSLLQIVAGLEAETVDLWLVTDRTRSTVCGAFVTDINREGDGYRFIGVSALGGSDVRSWFDAFTDRLVQFASKHRCSSVRAVGRKGWGRIAKQWRVVGSMSGQFIYEVEAAP